MFLLYEETRWAWKWSSQVTSCSNRGLLASRKDLVRSGSERPAGVPIIGGRLSPLGYDGPASRAPSSGASYCGLAGHGRRILSGALVGGRLLAMLVFGPRVGTVAKAPAGGELEAQPRSPGTPFVRC